MGQRKASSILCAVILLICLCSCGGKLANTGVGSILDVTDYGLFRLGYSDGSQAWKRFDRDTLNKDVKLAQKNRLKPARFVETPKGGTLTFPDGKTLLYFDNKPID